MPIQFHDTEDIAELGCAAFLHIVPSAAHASQRLGALFFLNARGEPLEFGYNRIELMQSVLWRAADQEQAAARRLALTLFNASTLTPSLLLCRADVIGPHLFSGGGLGLQIPVVRLATARDLVGYSGSEAQAVVESVDEFGECHDTYLFWTPAPPTGAAETLFNKLVERYLLLEPFARAEKGLREVYGELVGSPS